MLRGARGTSGARADVGTAEFEGEVLPASVTPRSFPAVPAGPLAAPISFAFAAANSAAETFAFTKRCSRGSYAMEDSLLRETTRTPESPCSTVLETRAGGGAGDKLLPKASRGADFTACHLAPGSPELNAPVAPFAKEGEKTPCSRFRGVLPFWSSGCMGTMPSVPPLRTNTAVTGRYTGRGGWIGWILGGKRHPGPPKNP